MTYSAFQANEDFLKVLLSDTFKKSLGLGLNTPRFMIAIENNLMIVIE
jgi:hypothetical protein